MPSDAPLKLLVIMTSTRPGRVGLPVAKWFHEVALENGSFDVDFCDLLELNLPMVDEPNHPRLKQYVHEHTKNGAHASKPPTLSSSSRRSTTTA